MIDPILASLQTKAGIVFMGAPDLAFQLPNIAHSYTLAMDAQPQLVTQSSAGIPAFLTTLVDSKLIETLVAPMKGADITGSELKKGTWLTDTAMFPIVESTGETSSYGDYNNNGVANANVNFTSRQSYHYQVITKWGERELERAGEARIDLANRKSIASALTLNKFQNKTYFFGVNGLQLYGLLNDPNLPAPIAPLAPVTGSTGTTWALKDANAIYNDVAALYGQLVRQAGGVVDRNTKMTLAMSPLSDAQLTKTNNFNVSVGDFIKKNFPNLKMETAPEYSTPSGELLQLYADNIEGQQTAEVAFTEKLRAHPVVVGLSDFSQKKSQGTWGGIIYRPFLVSSMLGV